MTGSASAHGLHRYSCRALNVTVNRMDRVVLYNIYIPSLLGWALSGDIQSVSLLT
uniref:Uncharacterized protein n=1 Tax=Anguilla anguilla TaxID=7936 RepID=A0A0E9XI19_ANGAN